MITVHHLHDSRSERILWLMEELGLPYRLDFHYRVPMGGGRLALRPDSPDYAEYLFWLHFAEGTLMSQILREFLLDRINADPEAFASKRLRERNRMYYKYVDARLAEAPYFGGKEFTAADIMMVFPFTTLQLFKKIDLTPYPNLTPYLARIGERPAYKKAMRLANGEERKSS